MLFLNLYCLHCCPLSVYILSVYISVSSNFDICFFLLNVDNLFCCVSCFGCFNRCCFPFFLFLLPSVFQCSVFPYFLSLPLNPTCLCTISYCRMTTTVHIPFHRQKIIFRRNRSQMPHHSLSDAHVLSGLQAP